jgi:hypothetical protein
MSTKLYVHPDYEARAKEWALYKKLYDGKHSELVDDPDILWRHYAETKDNDVAKAILAERKRRTRYLNVVEIIISIWTSFFFRETPVLSEAAANMLGDAQKNINGQGMTFNTMMKQALESRLIYGKAIARIDSLDKGSKLRPFVSLINPLDLVDWDFETQDQERVGQLNIARIVYNQMQKRTSVEEKPVKEMLSDGLFLSEAGIYSKRTYQQAKDKNGKVLTSATDNEAQWEAIGDIVESELREIPLVIIDDISWVKDVVQETLRHLNLRSSKDTIEHQQAFQKIFFEGIDPKDTAAINAISEHVYPILPKDARVHSIEPVSTSDISQSISQALDNAFKVGLNQLRQVAGDSKAIASGDTIQAEKDDRIALVESTLEELEGFGNEVLRHCASVRGEDNEAVLKDINISFSKEITQGDIEDFIKIWGATRDILIAYPNIKVSVAKKAVSKLFSGQDQADAIAEIEKTPVRAEPTQPEGSRPRSRLFDLGADSGEG